MGKAVRNILINDNNGCKLMISNAGRVLNIFNTVLK